MIVVGLLSAVSVHGASKQKYVPTRMKLWHFNNDFSNPDTVGIDTSYLNLPLQELPHTYSIANAYNGNLVSPLQSMIYFNRQEKFSFIFADAYAPYITTMSDVRFFNSTTPYSTIAYKRGFTTYREEHDLDFFFTGNINKRLNLGVGLNYLNGVGHYEYQAGKRFQGHIFGSYNGNHYSFQGAVVFNQLTNQENGGLQDVTELGGKLKSYDLAYNMEAMSALRHITGFFNHYYSITVEREHTKPLPEPKGGWQDNQARDTTIIEYIPVTTFKHTFECNQTCKRYDEQTAQTSFYQNTFFDHKQTNDTANILNIRNTLSVTFEEEFNKWLHFGATVYATNEFQRYGYHTADKKAFFSARVMNNPEWLLRQSVYALTDTTMGHHWVNNTMIGASIYKNNGKWVKFGFDGEVCLAGYKLGEFRVNGRMTGEFPIVHDTLSVTANAYLRNEQPDYFLQHYRSNHFVWDNDFNKIYRFFVGGEVKYPTKYVKPSVKVGFENITRHIYFGSDGMPHQTDKNIQVLSVDARLNILIKRFGMENEVVYQMTSSEFIPLPTLSLFHNIYYHDWWFKKAMGVQMGLTLRYHTAYYAPVLNPATAQFCIQDKEKVGNYPVLDMYANFYVRLLKLKFFAHWTHFNYFFMKHHTYLSMPSYPLNPSVFRAGVAWHFYR